jgi:hypothetical protein
MTNEQELQKRKQFGREVARIEGLPQAQRWREIKKLLLKVKPDLVPLDKDFVQQIREEREHNMLSETGASKSGSTRALYSMPQYLYAALHILDPDFTKLQEDPETSKEINLKLAKVFPEYCLARKV